MTSNISDVSPIYTILALGVYALLLFLGDKMKPSKLVSFIAKHSFSIYLVHMMILIPLKNTLPIFPGAPSFLMFIGVTLFVFIASTIAAFLIDTTIVEFSKKMFDRLFKRFLPKQDNKAA